MLQIEHLTKAYGDKKAVDDLSLHIRPGEIYGFIGHNGAGKTTTLKSAVGILRFDSGEIRINGRSIKDEPVACKRVLAYIPDNPDLYDFMTGIKYLNFVADIFGVPSEERRAKIDDYAARFELTDDLAQPIAAYSHGMKQKLAVIAAWLHSPKLIIMDEPFVGLDPKAAHLLKIMMRELCEEGGAIFFSTHVLEVAEKLCDKVAIIKGGRLIRSGTMEEVKGDDSLEDVFLELEAECAEATVHKQLSEIFRAYLYDAKKNKTRSKGATAAYIVLFVLIMAGMLGGMFTYLSLSICEPLSAAGMDWLYFALMGLIAILLGSFGSVFNTYSGLYLAKDNDLLLSMPIPVGVIMTARLLVGVYYGNFCIRELS